MTKHNKTLSLQEVMQKYGLQVNTVQFGAIQLIHPLKIYEWQREEDKNWFWENEGRTLNLRESRPSEFDTLDDSIAAKIAPLLWVPLMGHIMV